jgi:putative transposase
VHFLRNVASAVPKLHAPAVLAVVKSIFLQPTRETARDAVNHALNVLEPRFPSVAAKLRAAEAEVLAYLDFPVDHWRSISSTNAIERVTAELDRRAKVVGIFPNTDSLLRLFTAVLQDQRDEWQDGRRHISQQSMARVLHPDGPPLLTNPLTVGLVAKFIDVVRTPPNSHHSRGLDLSFDTQPLVSSHELGRKRRVVKVMQPSR